MTLIAGVAFVGRLIADRMKFPEHFRAEVAKSRWWAFLLLVGLISIQSLLLIVANAKANIASFVIIGFFVAICVGHVYLDRLLPYEEAERLARIERANEWLEEKIINKPD